MKRHPGNRSTIRCQLLSLALAASLVSPLPSLAASVALATSPLATSTTSSVKPNLLFVIDNSGSMDWDHMPDDASDGGSAVTFSYGYYGLRSSQCNQVYYDPNTNYLPPVYADGTSYPDATFTAAWTSGFNTGAGTVNLDTGFRASQSLSGDSSGQGAYYYSYSGAQTTSLQKNYNSTTNTFYNECHSAQNASPGRDVFTKISLSSTAAATTATIVANCSSCSNTTVSGITVNGAQIMAAATPTSTTTTTTSASEIAAQINLCTSAKVGNCTTTGGHGYTATVSGSTVTLTGLADTATSLIVTQSGSMTFTRAILPVASAAKLKNFANWYSYYRDRMHMMKTAAGRAFSSLNSSYRVGLMKISQTSPVVPMDTFEGTQRSNWYSALYNLSTSGSTPLRRALSDAGRYYAGKLSGTDPVQYSCQQNFTILSTDGYWNTGDGYKVDGVSAVGNQDGALPRPFYDGSTIGSARSTSQIQKTQTQTRQSTSQVQKRTQQLQSSKMYLFKSTNGGLTWAAATTCTWGGSTQCKYTKSSSSTVDWTPSTGTWANASSCTTSFSTDTTPGTTWSGTGRNCQTTDTGWVGASSCTSSSSNGKTITCQTVTTGPTLVDSCTSASPDAGNNYMTTSCSTTTILAAAPVASCTAETASATNNWTTTTCNTVTSGPTAGSCTPAAASAANNWITTTCTSVITGGGTSDNLADIAMYYYQTDLRTSTLGNCTGALGAGVDVCENNVFIGGNDTNTQQHMTTFTLGLGASGWMNYSSSYLSDTTGDYISVKQDTTASSTATPPVCSWQADATTCNWPIPGMDGSGNGFIANIDDLWHAAVNGHGAYFSATNPATLSAGLSNALAGINARKGSAAAAATSTLNPVAGNNFAYVASYTTVTWKGNLEARGINTLTGVVSENATWCAENVVAGTCAAPGTVVAETIGNVTVYNCVTPNSVICTGGVMDGTNCKVQIATACTGTMNARVADVSDTRTIKTPNSAGTALVDFTYANLDPANFAAAHISTLSQWTTLDAAQRTAAEGVNLVNYLRGQNGFEDRSANAAANRLYRYREAVLGDALESEPAFLGPPVFSYPYPGYSAFKAAQAGRAGTVYMGTNDGMMHAFASDTGMERWAYVPSMVITNMWKLADKNYSTLHLNFVNGSPITSDVCTANCTDSATAVWKTILVAGLNAGGRGYYALDITDPNTPVLLWEFTPTTGNGIIKDDDLGYSFGHPIITKKTDGTWVVLVTSGYNNTSPGNGKGYLYVLDAGTGAIISKIGTNVGSTTTPSGFAHIAGWNDEPAGNKVGYVYGGDLLGNVWRFDVNSSVAAVIGTGDVMKFATLFSDTAGTSPQPITTTPTLGKIAEKRVVFIGTGKYLETSDLTTTQKQTQYAIKDDNATATLVNPRNTLVNQTLTNNPDGTATRITSGNAVNFYTGRGWYVDFPDSGERVNIDSKLVQGTLLVPTIVPSNTACAPGGFGWLNFFDYKTGGAVNTATNLASLKYDATIVGVNVLYVQGQPKVGVVTSTNPTPELNPNVGFAATATGFSGKRVIWRELIP